jgi:hypothetical protein
MAADDHEAMLERQLTFWFRFGIWNDTVTRLRLLVLLFTIGVLVPLTPLAYSEPTDPIWIEGIYDDADLDDAIWLITSVAGVIDLLPPDGACSVLIVLALLPRLDEGAESTETPFSLQPRAPPAA